MWEGRNETNYGMISLISDDRPVRDIEEHFLDVWKED